MRLASEPDLAAQRPPAVWTPTDLGFNNVTWFRGGTNSLDIFVQGFSYFMVCGISDDPWALDYSCYNDTDTAILYGPVQVVTGNGRIAGQIDFFCGFIPLHAFGNRIRLRGRPLFGLLQAVNSSALVYAVAGAR